MTIETLKEQLANASPMFKRILQSRIDKLEFDASPIQSYASYLKSVYSFRGNEVYTQGYYHEPDVRDIHNFLTALRWRYKNVTELELKEALKFL